ncbi:MAG TPA: hypothetical protein PLH19_03105 [Anaerolineae bacterium]|nr:hypothetical protein [Anaerolineae bacterium]HQH37508.1 hypothetical protein [Anaerolineae bacterium]
MRQNVKWSLIMVLAMALALGVVTWGAAQASVIVEPSTLRTDLGGTVSLYATGAFTFTEGYTVRLLNYGILATHYVNPTALQATVPTGLSAGDYSLWVLNTEGVEIALGTLRLVEPPSPTATPKPESPPPPGRPILTVRNYTVEPLQVRPGQEFTVSVEVYNNGSRAGENTMAVFPGGTFIPLGDKGHLFWQVHINATFVATQRFRVPASTTNGIHEVEVQLSANDWEGNHYDYPATIPVEVIGASTGAAPTGKPEVLVEGVSTDPPVITPGAPFSLTLVLANRGSRTAINIMTSADPASAVPAEGGNIISTDVLRIDDLVTVTLPLLLKPVKEGGRQGLTIALEYSDYSGGNYSDQQTVGVDIDTSLANRPQLLINAYRTDPASISPGDSFTLTLDLANVGGGDAQRITLALGGEEGEELGMFVPLEGSNVSFVPGVAAGQTTAITMRLMVAGNAETKAYNLPVALAYDTETGTREKDTQRVSLMVFRRPQFKVSFYRPVEGMALVGQPLALPIEVVNSGTARFNIPTLEVTGAGLEFMEEPSTYVGNLDPGGSWTLDAMAMPLAPGPVDVVVNVYYVDDLNQTQVYSQTLTVEVMEMPQEGTPGGPDGPLGPTELPAEGTPETLMQKVLRFVKGFLGLGS